MDSYARSCYPMAVQAVRDAITKDSVGQTKEAYCCYLSSILFMIQALKDEAWEKKEIKDLCHDEAFKLYKLIEQSLGRARDILNAQNTDINQGQPASHKEVSSSLSSPVQSNTRSLSPTESGEDRRASSTGLIASLPSPPGLISSLPTPPGFPEIPVRSSIPKSYQAQNYDMFQAYQHRKSKDSVLQKYASCNYNMSMFRQIAEKKKLDDAKEKVYQEKMLKRRQEIKIEAERRWNQMNTRSSRDKEYRQNLLETILAYEQDARWPITIRDTLVLNNEDTNTITKVVRTILTYNEHPLCIVLKEIQYEIYSNIEPLIKDLKLPRQLSNDYYLVPVEAVISRDRNNTMPAFSHSDDNAIYQNTEIDRSRTSSVNVDKIDRIDVSTGNKNNLDNSLENKFNDLVDDMFSSDSENEEVNEEVNKTYSLLRTNTTSQSISEETGVLDKNIKRENIYSDNDIYNHLWNTSDGTYQELTPETDINEVDDSTEGIYQDPIIHHTTTDPSSHYEGLTGYQENIYEDVNEVVASIIRSEHSARSISPVTLKRLNSEFLKSLDRVVQDIIFGIDRLHSVIILTYESMDAPVGRDISYANLECIFFKPIWPWLIRVFRKMNIDKEDALAEVMSTYKDCGPSKINIRDKLSLGGDQDPETDPYLEAIEEMKQVVQFTSPLDKLECTVRVSKAICHCVETYYTERGERAPSVGCDDLLPLVSYVVLKSQLPQIVSECHAMTEFIHDGYLMGEEGYCLTTLHAAISNLLSYAKPRV